MSKAELHVLDSIESSFKSKWYTPEHGNLLWRGLDGNGARTPADAFAKWQLDGAHFVTIGLDHSFAAQRLKAFAQIKREAEKLFA